MKFLNYFGWIFLGLILVLMVTILGANIYVAVTMEDFKCADITQPKFELDQCNEHLDLLCEFNVPYSEPCYYEEPEEYPECVTFEEELEEVKTELDLWKTTFDKSTLYSLCHKNKKFCNL